MRTNEKIDKIINQLNQYDIINGDKILVPIPEFFERENDPWYGFMLFYRDSRDSIEVYVSYDGKELNKLRYINTYNINKPVNDILEECTNEVMTCCICKKRLDINEICVIPKGHICPDCRKKLDKKSDLMHYIRS